MMTAAAMPGKAAIPGSNPKSFKLTDVQRRFKVSSRGMAQQIIGTGELSMATITEAPTSMAESNGKPCGMPWISPYLTVKDAGASLAFYEAAFGLAPMACTRGPDGSIMHVQMTWNEGVIMFGPRGLRQPDTVSGDAGDRFAGLHVRVLRGRRRSVRAATAAGATAHFRRPTCSGATGPASFPTRMVTSGTSPPTPDLTRRACRRLITDGYFAVPAMASGWSTTR